MAKMQNIQMPTILHEGSVPGRFRIIPHVPLYHFCSYRQCWYRVLMLEHGYYLRIQLTPCNPTIESEWLELLNEQILWGLASWSVWDAGTERYTHTLPESVIDHMRYHLGSPHANRLLTGDIWAEIASMWPVGYTSPHEVSDWLSRCGYNGGIPLAKVQKNPGTWEEIHAARDKRIREERDAKIAAILGPLAPLSELENELGLSLASHDWSYEYSDSLDVCRRGREHREQLTRAFQALPVERARAIWAAYAPDYSVRYWECPV